MLENCADVFPTWSGHKSASSWSGEAVNFFIQSSKKIPEARDYYSDLAQYMRAWSEIESARDSHLSGRCSKSKEHYEKLLDCLKNPKAEPFSASLSCACPARRRRRTGKIGDRDCGDACLSRRSSGKASFRSEFVCKKHVELDQIFKNEPGENGISKTEIDATATIADASLTCQRYCDARILIEEAKLAYERGQNTQASQMYSSAAESLEHVLTVQQGEVGKKELAAMITFARAWQKFHEAEASASIKLFKEAMDLFQKTAEVEESSLALIARGNENYSFALAAGLKFQESMNTDDYASAKSHLILASEYYSKAGFPSEAEWFRATERMLDAYLHIISALKEPDQEKKAKHYLAAEEVLRIASNIYEKAGYLSKRDEVMSRLKKVHEERGACIVLRIDAFSPVIVPNTASFSTAALMPEQSSGIEQFEGANVQVAVHVPDKVLSVGEEFEVRIDLINTGREAANLHFVDNIPKLFSFQERHEKDSSLAIVKEPLSVVELRVKVQASSGRIPESPCKDPGHDNSKFE